MKIQTAPLTKQEFLGLMRLAQREVRTPNEQLRYLVRCALGMGESPGQCNQQPNKTTSAKVEPTNAAGGSNALD